MAIPKGGRGGRRAETRDYNYAVTNAGQGTLTEVYLWHQTPGGEVCSTRAGGLMVLRGGQDADALLSLQTRAPYPDVQELWFEWVDDDGKHTAYSEIIRSMEP